MDKIKTHLDVGEMEIIMRRRVSDTKVVESHIYRLHPTSRDAIEMDLKAEYDEGFDIHNINIVAPTPRYYFNGVFDRVPALPNGFIEDQFANVYTEKMMEIDDGL